MPTLEDLGRLMNARTRLVCVTHASNLLGSINPIREIADFVHARGALICVDGVAYAPHRAIDVRELDVDYYVFSLLQDLRAALCRHVRPPRPAARARRPLPLFLRQGQSAREAGARQPLLRARLGRRRHRRLSRGLAGSEGRAAIERPSTASRRTRPRSESGCLHGCAGATGSASSATEARMRHCVYRRSASPSMAIRLSDIVAAIDDARLGVRHGDFHSRRLIRGTGPGAMPASSASRWCTTIPWRKSTG